MINELGIKFKFHKDIIVNGNKKKKRSIIDSATGILNGMFSPYKEKAIKSSAKMFKHKLWG